MISSGTLKKVPISMNNPLSIWAQDNLYFVNMRFCYCGNLIDVWLAELLNFLIP